MLDFDRFPMHQQARVIQLSDVLATIIGDDLEWSILDFQGAGVAPNGMDMPDFEELVRLDRHGYRITWSALAAFAQGLQQTWECLIVGTLSIDRLSLSDLEDDGFRRLRCRSTGY